MPVKTGRRFLRGHAYAGCSTARDTPIPLSSQEGAPRGQGRVRAALLIDKPALRPGMRKLSLKGGTIRPGRLYWCAEYPATDRAAKKDLYQQARAMAAEDAPVTESTELWPVHGTWPGPLTSRCKEDYPDN